MRLMTCKKARALASIMSVLTARAEKYQMDRVLPTQVEEGNEVAMGS